MRRWVSVILAAIIVLPVVTACGGDDERAQIEWIAGTPPSGSAQTESPFRAAASKTMVRYEIPSAGVFQAWPDAAARYRAFGAGGLYFGAAPPRGRRSH